MSSQNNILLTTELIAAKFTHDISGLVGAVMNGIEFINDNDHNMQKKAIDLVQKSTDILRNRLEFYRYIYGYTKVSGDVLLSQLRIIAKNFFSDKKISLNWTDINADGSDININHTIGRVILHILYIMSSCLINSGEIGIETNSQDIEKNIKFIGHSQKIKINKDYIQILLNGYNQVKPDIYNIQYYFLAMLMETVNATLNINFNDNEIVINLSLI